MVKCAKKKKNKKKYDKQWNNYKTNMGYTQMQQ